jgi:hypothetical protein
VAAAIQFLGTFSFLMAHNLLPKEDISQTRHIYPAKQDVQSLVRKGTPQCITPTIPPQTFSLTFRMAWGKIPELRVPR